MIHPVKIGELLIDVMVRIGHAKSKREARYLIEQGAVSIASWRPARPALEKLAQRLEACKAQTSTSTCATSSLSPPCAPS